MRKCRREDSLNPQEAYHLIATSMVTWQCNVNWLPINYSKNRIHLSPICILGPKLNLNLKSFSFSMKKKKRHTTIPTKRSLTSHFFFWKIQAIFISGISIITEELLPWVNSVALLKHLSRSEKSHPVQKHPMLEREFDPLGFIYLEDRFCIDFVKL